MAGITCNGIDLKGLGFRARFATSLLTGTRIAAPGLSLIDRAGPVLLAPRATDPRLNSLRGPLLPVARTVSSTLTASHLLKDLFYSGRLTFVETDSAGNAIQATGVCTGFDVVALDRRQGPKVLDLTVSLQLDPTTSDVEPTLRALAVAGTRYDVPLGTAPSSWILNIMGVANNPVVTARMAGGQLLWALTFTKNLDNTNKWLSLDAVRGRIWLYESGAKTDGIALLTGGQADWPRPLDPQDGDYGSSQYLTLEVNPGTAELLWWKRYQ